MTVVRQRIGTRTGLDRRSFLVGSALSVSALGLSACKTSDTMSLAEAQGLTGRCRRRSSRSRRSMSARSIRNTTAAPSVRDEGSAGTIIVDPKNYYVYRIEEGGAATRYGANVGRDGFLWSGDAYVGRKSEWATWTPPKEMIKRQPEAAKLPEACRVASTTPSAPARFISIRTAPTRCTRSTRAATRNDRQRHHQRLRRPAEPGHDPSLRAPPGEGRRSSSFQLEGTGGIPKDLSSSDRRSLPSRHALDQGHIWPASGGSYRACMRSARRDGWSRR